MNNRFAVDQKQEEERILALRNRNAIKYHMYCDALGIDPEDELLYEQGLVREKDIVIPQNIYGIPRENLKSVAQEIYNHTIARGQKPEDLSARDVLYVLNERGIGRLVFPSGKKELTSISSNEAIKAGLEVMIAAGYIKDPRRD